jgi:hypothetical protein
MSRPIFEKNFDCNEFNDGKFHNMGLLLSNIRSDEFLISNFECSNDGNHIASQFTFVDDYMDFIQFLDLSEEKIDKLSNQDSDEDLYDGNTCIMEYNNHYKYFSICDIDSDGSDFGGNEYTIYGVTKKQSEKIMSRLRLKNKFVTKDSDSDDEPAKNRKKVVKKDSDSDDEPAKNRKKISKKKVVKKDSDDESYD